MPPALLVFQLKSGVSRLLARTCRDDALGFEDRVLLAIPANERGASERSVGLAVECGCFVFPIRLRCCAGGLRASAEKALARGAALEAWFAHRCSVTLMVVIAVMLVGVGARGRLASDQCNRRQSHYGTNSTIRRHQENSLFNDNCGSTKIFGDCKAVPPRTSAAAGLRCRSLNYWQGKAVTTHLAVMIAALLQSQLAPRARLNEPKDAPYIVVALVSKSAIAAARARAEPKPNTPLPVAMPSRRGLHWPEGALVA